MSTRATSASACRSRWRSPPTADGWRVAGVPARVRSASPMTAGVAGGRGDRRGRADRVLQGRRAQRDAARVRGDRRRARRRRPDARRRRRPRELHDRPGRGDRARPVRRRSARSGGRAACPTAAAGSRACCCTRPPPWPPARPGRRGRVPGRSRPARARRFGAAQAATEPDVGALGHHRDAVVHAVRRADAGVVDGAQRRPGTCTPTASRAPTSVGRSCSSARTRRRTRRAWFYERPDHARRPPGVALDRRAVHPPLRLLPGDRRRGRARRSPSAERAADAPDAPVLIAAAAGRGLVRAGDRHRPLPAATSR